MTLDPCDPKYDPYELWEDFQRYRGKTGQAMESVSEYQISIWMYDRTREDWLGRSGPPQERQATIKQLIECWLKIQAIESIDPEKYWYRLKIPGRR